MKNKPFLILAFYLLTLLSSCGVDYSNPEKIVKSYLDDHVKKDYKSAYQLISTKSKEFATEDEFLIQSKGADSTWNDKLSYSDVTLIEKDVDKPSYKRFKAIYQNIHKNDTSKFRIYITLINENDKWKICWTSTLLKQADDKYKDGNYTETIKICEKAIEIDPYSNSSYSFIGWCYRNDNSLTNEERKSGMLKNYKYALSIEPDQALNYNNLAVYYGFSGENDLAAEQYKKAINYTLTEKSKSVLYRNLSFCYSNNSELAMTNAKKATELNSSEAMNWERLGFLLYSIGNLEEANKSFEKVFALPELPNYLKHEFYYEYSLNLRALNNWAKAKEYILKGLEIDPNNQKYKNLYSEIKSNGY